MISWKSALMHRRNALNIFTTHLLRRLDSIDYLIWLAGKSGLWRRDCSRNFCLSELQFLLCEGRLKQIFRIDFNNGLTLSPLKRRRDSTIFRSDPVLGIQTKNEKSSTIGRNR